MKIKLPIGTARHTAGRCARRRNCPFPIDVMRAEEIGNQAAKAQIPLLQPAGGQSADARGALIFYEVQVMAAHAASGGGGSPPGCKGSFDPLECA